MRTNPRNAMGALLLASALGLWACRHGADKADEKAGGPAQAPAVQAAMAEAEKQPTRANGQKVADELMAQWKRHHPDRDWVAEEHEKHQIVAPASNADLVGQGQGATYGRISETDVALWDRELRKAVAEGSRVFHSAQELRSPIGVSCDMCHPDASNTHPETYPKYQVQMGRVAHLRDMINWCIQQPLRAAPLAPDDPKMRALEAYILAQRKGTAMNYGRR